MFRFLGGAAARLVVLLLLASFLGAVLVRMSPGFGSDEAELNSGLSAESIAALRHSHQADAKLFHFYPHYLASLLRGDLGNSVSLDQPVRELLRQRLPVTVRGLGISLALGWALALMFAVAAYCLDLRSFTALSELLSGALISTPAAALALLFVILRWPAVIAASLLLFPKIFRYVHDLMRQSAEMPHVLTARARGAGTLRVLIWHVAPIALPQLVALAGVSLSLALTILLPVEVVCDVPGIGQLAWHAAQARDLQLLVTLTLLVTLVTVVATLFSEAAQHSWERSAA